ncbi:hypothetical protein [Mannheimia pernigra]|uniref:Uncharacterized protein n=1 Tax=Mannheimia pernigra TaxID=111844 RepID=A0A7D5DVJ6_9PAST|nr:hypothetical protein [Mannheimia pernigra]QLB39546.1 hypothetical protein HV559_00855 [Mannheimia pernigra]
MNDNCAFRVYFNRIAHDKYTYDNYDRVATRSFDTNLTKQGFERVETYDRDVYGRAVRTDNDIVGQGGKIDSYTTYVSDIFGRTTDIKTYSDDKGSFELHQTKEYNQYGDATKTTSYNAQNQVSRIFNSESDEYNRQAIHWTDNNYNGKFDGNETKHILTRDPANGRLISRIEKYANGSPELNVKFYYDETDRHVATLFDKNNNGTIEKGDTYSVRQYFEGSRSLVDYFERYQGKQESNGVAFGEPNMEEGLQLVDVLKLHYSYSGQSLGTLYADGERVFKNWAYNGGNGAPVSSSTEDYTDSKFEPLLEQIGGTLREINLSNATQSTDIAFDNDTLAKLSGNNTTRKLIINGDNTDTVRLKDHAEFKEIENVKEGKNDYKQYTTEVDGQQYTLLIDTDINVVLA